MATTDVSLPDDYQHVLADLKRAVTEANIRAMRTVNVELLHLYWIIGRRVSEQEARQGWGSRVVDRLAADLRSAYPQVRGFSPRNLRYMRSFAREWPDGESMLQQPVARLGWGSITTLIDRLDDPELRDWYAAQSVENGWSRAVLVHQIDNALHSRLGSAPSNLSGTLAADTDLARQLTKDPFVLDFLDIGGRVSERQLEDALIHRLERFMLELGRGFAFVGRQMRLEVGGDEFFVDLLFFHVSTLRYLVLELKIEKFTPQHLGQLDFYVNVVDDQFRDHAKHAETLGILLCPDKNDVVVEYATRGRTTPLSVNRYTLIGLTEAEKAALPSPDDLKQALRTPAPDEPHALGCLDRHVGADEPPTKRTACKR